MLDNMLIAPLTPFAERHQGFVSRLIAMPARWMEARKVAAEIAVLSEREWRDIGGTRPEDEPAAPANDENPAERAARARAIRAWYGHGQKAA